MLDVSPVPLGSGLGTLSPPSVARALAEVVLRRSSFLRCCPCPSGVLWGFIVPLWGGSCRIVLSFAGTVPSSSGPRPGVLLLPSPVLSFAFFGVGWLTFYSLAHGGVSLSSFVAMWLAAFVTLFLGIALCSSVCWGPGRPRWAPCLLGWSPEAGSSCACLLAGMSRELAVSRFHDFWLSCGL